MLRVLNRIYGGLWLFCVWMYTVSTFHLWQLSITVNTEILAIGKFGGLPRNRVNKNIGRFNFGGLVLDRQPAKLSVSPIYLCVYSITDTILQ